MNSLGRIFSVAILVIALCFTVIGAREADSERKDAIQTKAVADPTLGHDNSVVPLLPTGTTVSPDAGEQINWWVIGAGGGSGSSTNYTLSGTIGQTAVQSGSSPSYGLLPGYWQVFGSGDCCVGRVGDANGLGGDEPTIGDVSVMIDAKFIAGVCVGILDCMTEADVNQTGLLAADCDDVTIGDISILIDYLFITGPSLGLNNCL